MKIAQIAPLFESVPPRLYGGTERVVSWLTEELVALGHDVTVFASGDSKTSAKLVPCAPQCLWNDPKVREPTAHHVRQVELLMQQVTDFDVIHFHIDYVHYPLLRYLPRPAFTTLHGALYESDQVPMLRAFPDAALVSISDSQRRPIPEANWIRTVYHGLPRDLHRFSKKGGDYFAFLGRVCPEKGLDRAIRIAMRAGVKLKIAAKVYVDEVPYHERVIEPMLREAGDLVEFVGEVGGEAKDEFLRNARGMLFPIDWQEPFGLVMIEAMACGTPVIAWRNGSVPEVIDHGLSGFIVESEDEAVRAIASIGEISREKCREIFEQRFDSVTMAKNYVDVYDSLLEDAFETDSAPRLIVPAGLSLDIQEASRRSA